MSVHCSLVVLRVEVARVSGDPVADALRDAFLLRYEQSGATHAIVDMAEVTYLSSVGIGPLLALNRKVREREGRLILCSMSENVEGVFQATKLIGSAHGTLATFEHHADVVGAVGCLYKGE